MVQASDNLSIVMYEDYLYSFGKERRCRLGLGLSTIHCTEKPHPIKFPNLLKVAGIACGQMHCLVWDTEGLLYSWGDGKDGKLGHGTVNGKYNYTICNPEQVKSILGHKVEKATCGFRHSCILTYKGEIWSFGRSHYNQKHDEEVNLDFVRPQKL